MFFVIVVANPRNERVSYHDPGSPAEPPPTAADPRTWAAVAVRAQPRGAEW